MGRCRYDTGNHFLSKGYRIHGASAAHPLGPFTDYDHNPLAVRTEGAVVGLGHSSTVCGPDLVSDWMFCHNLNPDKTRDLDLDRVLFRRDDSFLLSVSDMTIAQVGRLLFCTDEKFFHNKVFKTRFPVGLNRRSFSGKTKAAGGGALHKHAPGASNVPGACVVDCVKSRIFSRHRHHPLIADTAAQSAVSETKFCVPYSTSVSVMPFSLAYSTTSPLKKRRSITCTSA